MTKIFALLAALLLLFATPVHADVPPVKPLVPGTSWNWQIGSNPTAADIAIVGRLANPHKMLDVDMVNSSPALISQIHASGIYVVCYLETGSWENYRPDAAQFPAASKGKTLDGYAAEKYLDINNAAVLPLIKNRIASAASKGCDGIEPDLDDTWSYGKGTTGFTITLSQNILYNKALADYAHSLGLSFGLKNGADRDFVAYEVTFTDWALNEQCNQYSECFYKPYIDAGKAVFQVEYQAKAQKTQCAKDNAANYDGLAKKVALNATPRTACRNG